MHSPIALSVLALMAGAGSAVAKTIAISVGQGGLVFSPATSTADVGDVLEFHFFSSFHTAVQGDFTKPCQRASGGFNSGSINNKPDGSGSVFQVTVKDTNPIFFYCSTPSHCQSGMAGVINPSSSQTLDSYKSAAAGTSSSEGSSSVAGGVVVPVGTAPSSSAAPAPASSSPAASSPVSSTPPPGTSSSAAPPAGSSSGTSAPASSSAAAPGTTSTAAATTSTGTGTTSAAATKPTTVTTSGASGPQSSVVASSGMLVSLAVGLGLLVCLMA